MTNDEQQIRAVLTDFTAAIRKRDAHAAIALLADDAVTFDLAPPLRMGPKETHDPAELEAWFATWESPITSEPRDLTIAVGDDVECPPGRLRALARGGDDEREHRRVAEGTARDREAQRGAVPDDVDPAENASTAVRREPHQGATPGGAVRTEGVVGPAPLSSRAHGPGAEGRHIQPDQQHVDPRTPCVDVKRRHVRELHRESDVRSRVGQLDRDDVRARTLLHVPSRVGVDRRAERRNGGDKRCHEHQPGRRRSSARPHTVLSRDRGCRSSGALPSGTTPIRAAPFP